MTTYATYRSLPRIELIENPHSYRVDGREVRSWSSIAKAANLLPDYGKIPPEILANAAGRGRQIDDACSLIMEGRPLDLEQVHPEAVPYVEAFRAWWARYWLPDVRVQTPLYCRKLDYCCTPDFIGPQSVNDLKATDKPSRTWGLQTAAQYLAHGEALARRIIWLRPKLKREQVHVFTSYEGDRRVFSALDLQVVEAACNGDYDADCIQRWRKGE